MKLLKEKRKIYEPNGTSKTLTFIDKPKQYSWTQEPPFPFHVFHQFLVIHAIQERGVNFKQPRSGIMRTYATLHIHGDE